MKNFYERHKNDTNRINMDLWDAGVINYVKLELLFFSKKNMDQFFTASCEFEKNPSVATEHSSYLEFATAHIKSNTSTR